MVAWAHTLFAVPPTWYIGFVSFLSITTYFVYIFLQRPGNADPEKFTRLYLLSITVKILVACVFVITFVMSDRPGADYNALFFLVGYVIFTAAEVIFLLLKAATPKS
jgi:hypothetical protein